MARTREAQAAQLIEQLRALVPEAGDLMTEIEARIATRMGRLDTSLTVARGVTEALDRQLLETALLADLGRSLLARTSVDAVAARVLRVMGEHMVPRRSVIAVRRVETGEAVVYLPDREPEPVPDEAESLLGLCLSGHPSARSTDLPGRAFLPETATLPWAGATGAVVVGRDLASGRLAIGIGLEDGADLGFDTLTRLRCIARFAAPAVEGALLHEEAARRARTDTLTGLGNRVCYDEAIKSAFERAKRYGQPLALAVIDLDRFKQINDQLGHEVGDMVLRDFGGVLREAVRREDVCCRTGGDEFVVIMPGLMTNDAEAALARIEERVSGSALKNFNASMSYGVAAYPADGRIARQIYTKADKRMYERKAGRRTPLALRPDVRAAG